MPEDNQRTEEEEEQDFEKTGEQVGESWDNADMSGIQGAEALKVVLKPDNPSKEKAAKEGKYHQLVSKDDKLANLDDAGMNRVIKGNEIANLYLSIGLDEMAMIEDAEAKKFEAVSMSGPKRGATEREFETQQSRVITKKTARI